MRRQDEETAQPKLFYAKVHYPITHSLEYAINDGITGGIAAAGHCKSLRPPPRPHARYALLLPYSRYHSERLKPTDVATGGSAMKAVEVLMEHGVPEDRIIFINLVCLRALCGVGAAGG